MIIVGIDPSLTGTALCALKPNKDSALEPEIISVKTIIAPKGVVDISRLSFISRMLNKEIKNVAAQPAAQLEDMAMFIEGYAYMAKGRSVFNLGELGGILRLMLAYHWSGYYEVPPTSLKKFITGKGNSKKNVMLEQTFRKYGKGSDILKDDNQVDAYGLARFGLAFMGLSSKVLDYEGKSLQGVQDKHRITSLPSM